MMSQNDRENGYFPISHEAPGASTSMDQTVITVNNNNDTSSAGQTCKTDSDESSHSPRPSNDVALPFDHIDDGTRGQLPPDPYFEPTSHFEYLKEYPIHRFSRKWKRQEVQGFCCLAIEVICLTILAVMSLNAVGYFEDVKQEGHLPLTFSWKILWEFFGNTLLPKKLMECLFSNIGGRVIIREEENYGLDTPMAMDYVFQDPYDSDAPLKTKKSMTATQLARSPDRSRCEFQQARYSLNWLIKFFLITNFMPVLNLVCSTLLYVSLRIRRRKGMQVLLLLPSFFCFFVSIFQQIPISFQYNYLDQTLLKEMHQTLAQSSPPLYIVPILDETQIHHQCCGVEAPESWTFLPVLEGPVYPPSCCNYTAWNCSSLETIRRKHVWSVGCYHVEQTKVHSFERLALFLYALKVIAEVGIFCTLSDLTRFEYPAAEAMETSRCDFREYQITCRGVLHIKGITKDGRVVIMAKYFLPWRLITARVEMLNGVQMNVKTDRNQTKGTVQIVKRQHAENFQNEDIQIDLSRKARGIFVFTLV